MDTILNSYESKHMLKGMHQSSFQSSVYANLIFICEDPLQVKKKASHMNILRYAYLLE